MKKEKQTRNIRKSQKTTLNIHFCISNAFFNSASVLLNFFMNWASNVAYVLLSTYKNVRELSSLTFLVHITVIILRHSLYLVYLCTCLRLGLYIYIYLFISVYIYLGLRLFMSYWFDLFIIFNFTFIVMNHTTTLTQTYFFFVHFLDYLLLILDDDMNEESKQFSNSNSSASGSVCLAFAWLFANFSLAWLLKCCLTQINVC